MIYKALIGIVGPSGSGKSTSIRNLPKDTTRIIDIERKGFPFKGIEGFNVIAAAHPAEVEKAVKTCVDDKTVTHIVVESLTKYLENLYKFANQAYKGWDVWSYFNKQIGSFLDSLKNDHACVIFTAIDEIVKIPEASGAESAAKRIAVKGKEWEGKIEKEMLMVFYTHVKFNQETKKMDYLFQTNTDGITSAKTPMDMFPDMLIPNDLNAALVRAREFYGAQTA